MSLFRCVVCDAYTLAEPLLVLSSWRVHLSCCLDCMTSDDVAMERHLRPVHKAVGAALHALFVSGRWVLALRA